MDENVFELRETFKKEHEISKKELKEKIKNAVEAIVEMTKNFPPDTICKVWKENREFDSFECKKESEGTLAVFWGDIEIGKFQYDDIAEKELEKFLKENFPRFFKGIACYHIDVSIDHIKIFVNWKETHFDNYEVFDRMIRSCGFLVLHNFNFPGERSQFLSLLAMTEEPYVMIKVGYEKLNVQEKFSCEKQDIPEKLLAEKSDIQEGKELEAENEQSQKKVSIWQFIKSFFV